MTKKIIVDAKSDSKGNISFVKFKGNNSFTPVNIAIKLAERDEIENAHSVNLGRGKKYLRSNPDGKLKNNLDELAKT